MLRRSVTQQYPEVHPDLPPRSRGVIALVAENCTSCMLCARECPDWCIYIDSHKETLPAPEGGRARQRNVLDRFAIDFSLCMYCGICIEVCPFDALFWSPEFEYADGDIRNLLHEKEQLAGWAETVPPPPAHEVGAEPPKELAAPTGLGPRTPGGRAAGARTAGPPGSPGSPAPEARPRRTPEGPASTPATAGAESPADSTTGPSSAVDDTATSRPADNAATSPSTGNAATSPSADSGTGRERPVRRLANVRGIRPPGALPPTPGTPPPAPPSSQPESPEPASPSTEVSPPPDASGETLSTGRQSGEELSTGSGAPSPESDPEEQTSAAEPRRRRMADPRSIRPPGRLQPDETRESEEET
ncbi:4Fe-4S binding protein [Nonomuraea sp. NPDC050556]|uniref:4Fe-4S binding protein n=1 Tax=Nonomuraea sp. NPDC050556 TaxID=3364369 RepID=UPI0037B5C4F6